MAILSLLQSPGLDRCSIVCDRARRTTLSHQRTRVPFVRSSDTNAARLKEERHACVFGMSILPWYKGCNCVKIDMKVEGGIVRNY
jgi:hypothetical protein